MKFILNEIKLWFNDNKHSTKSYHFLPNKINVITGGSGTGKTSFLSIIDYCLLCSKVNIPNDIIDRVDWFGINLTINDRIISIIRKTPDGNRPSNDVCFNNGYFPESINANKQPYEIKAILDEEFGITDSLIFPFGEELGAVSFNVSYRHFLLFNALTENIIGDSDTYFDTAFYGKEEYDNALNHIFELVIGIDGMKIIKADERLKEIKSTLKKIKTQHTKNTNNITDFETKILTIVDNCKKYGFIDSSKNFEKIEDAINEIKILINEIKIDINKSKQFSNIDTLTKKRYEINSQINAIKQYQIEYKRYKNNLEKSADSLKPIEYLNTKLSDQLLDSRETKLFINILSDSLAKIKDGLSRNIPPIKVKGNLKELEEELKKINKSIQDLNKIEGKYLKQSERFVHFGEIKYAFEQMPEKPLITPIDKEVINKLNDEKSDLEKVPNENKGIKGIMEDNLNESIQRNFNKLTTIETYSTCKIKFDENDMNLKLYRPDELFPLTNIGSKSNYMILHLCTYLGFHEHMINIGQIHVPQFLFIDQPSIPYYGTNKNDDKRKLIDAFKLLNSFIEYITVEKNNEFQIFMVEHAPKEYWENNNLSHFHLVDEFVDGNGLIPNNIYNSKD